MIRKTLVIVLALFAVAACGRKEPKIDIGAPTYGPRDVNMVPTSDPGIVPTVEPPAPTPNVPAGDTTK